MPIIHASINVMIPVGCFIVIYPADTFYLFAMKTPCRSDYVCLGWI